MIVAHVAGVPVEETLLPLVSGLGAAFLLARAWVMVRVRRPPSLRARRRQDADGPLV